MVTATANPNLYVGRTRKKYHADFRINPMRRTESVPIAENEAGSETLRPMNATGNRPGGKKKKEPIEGSLVCAICKRRFKPLRSPGVNMIYSICPDCRLDPATPR